MCGACGRTVVADDVLGAERTLRSQYMVVQVFKEVCATLPGLPTLQVAGDGWLVRAATGGVHMCQTVGHIWAVFISTATHSGTLAPLLQAIKRDLSEAEGLARDILLAGLEAGSPS